MKKGFILIIGLLLLNVAKAHDFVVTINKHKVYFAIVDDKNNQAIVTYKGSIAEYQPSDYAGELTVPSKVRHNNKVYDIVGIGAKAFSGATKLKSVILPNSINEIGAFAFEGCSSLEKVVFPAKYPKFGEGTFFMCNKIKEVSLGDEWTSVNFVLFQWSDNLKAINIPAKVDTIRGLYKLIHLESINVDENNEKFASIDGVLYNKKMTTLYRCPRAYEGKLTVPEGVETIFEGALIDCPKLENIDLPQSLKHVSFREFSRMANLKEMLFRAENPIKTAKLATNQEYFLLQVANPKVKVSTPKVSLKKYKKLLANQEGEYYEIGKDRPYLVKIDNMLKAKNIVGAKLEVESK